MGYFKRQKRQNREQIIQIEAVKYLKLKYAKLNLLIFSDLAGVNLNKEQRYQYAMRSKEFAFPDLMIFYKTKDYSGLMLELKKENVRLFKRNGDPYSEHIAKQDKTLKALTEQGFCSNFAIGLDDALKQIDNYFKNEI